MLTNREMLLLYLFTGLEKREYELMVYLLMHNNQYIGTYTNLGRILKSDSSNIRKLVLSMERKHYIWNLKDHATNKRVISITKQIIDWIGEC